MKVSPADLILHPLRLRIVELLVSADPMTPQEMLKQLKGVAPATLYRHLKLLRDGEIISAVGTRPVRGVVEHSYTVDRAPAGLSPQEILKAGREERLRHFARFVSVLLGQYAEYLGREKVDLLADGVGYRQLSIYASDGEFKDFTRKLVAVLGEASQQPGEGRKRRWVTVAVMPAAEPVPGTS